MKIDYRNIIDVPEEGLSQAEMPAGEIPEEMKDRVDMTLIPEECLQEKIRDLAGKICSDYAGKKELNLVIVLNGAAFFATDLGREIFRHGGPGVKYNFIKASTYGNEIKDAGERSREVKIELEPGNLRGADVILVEDIVDQGFTLYEIKKYLLGKGGARSLKICVLLDKVLKNPTREVMELREKLVLDYTGFKIPDRWVAGYGIDAGEDFRQLPFIITVKEEYYLKNSFIVF